MLASLGRGAGILGLRATLQNVRRKSAYEGEGKTTVRVLNQELDLGIMIDSYSTFGFRLNNGITIVGPVALFPRSVLSWQVQNSMDVTESSLRLFKLLEPRVDLLVVGLEAPDRALAAGVLAAARRLALNVEVLTTEHACSTFNFLNSEGRSVAAALIPPLSLQLSEDDVFQSQKKYNAIHDENF